MDGVVFATDGMKVNVDELNEAKPWRSAIGSADWECPIKKQMLSQFLHGRR